MSIRGWHEWAQLAEWRSEEHFRRFDAAVARLLRALSMFRVRAQAGPLSWRKNGAVWGLWLASEGAVGEWARAPMSVRVSSAQFLPSLINELLEVQATDVELIENAAAQIDGMAVALERVRVSP